MTFFLRFRDFVILGMLLLVDKHRHEQNQQLYDEYDIKCNHNNTDFVRDEVGEILGVRFIRVKTQFLFGLPLTQSNLNTMIMPYDQCHAIL